MSMDLQRIGLFALAGTGLAGTVLARRAGLEGEPLGLRWPWGPRSEVLLWGTAISAPIALDLAIIGAAVALPRSRGLARLMGATVLVGQAIEPIARRLDEAAPVHRAVVVANLTLASVVILAGGRPRYG